MLKQCLINVDFSVLHAKQQLRPKCGEIFYESDNEYCSFQLVCCLCQMKHFAFDDFSMHIRNAHFDRDGKPRTQPMNQSTIVIDSEPEADPDFPASLGNLLSEDASDAEEQMEDEDMPEATYRICSFKKAKTEVKELAKFELVSQSEDEGETISSGAVDQEQSEAEEDDVDSQIEAQYVFKKQRQAKEYNCKYCTGKYTTLKYLNIHLKMCHPHPKGFKCDECGATFDVERALETHRRKLHTEFSCNLCDKIYKSSRTLLRHVQGHSGLRQYKCDYENCGKSFVSQHNLTSHRRIHSTERNYVCELCGYRSRYRDALIVHRRTHTGEKPFKCQTCARCFASKSLLNEHQAMHSTERPYKCDKCEAAFSRPKALYHHKHLHLGIKKFKCKICGNAYAQAAGLSAHMRSHKAQTVNGLSADIGEKPVQYPPY